MDNFDKFDEGDIVRPYIAAGVLKLYKITHWISNDVIKLQDVESGDIVVIDVDILYENYTKKGVPEAALILYGDKSEN